MTNRYRALVCLPLLVAMVACHSSDGTPTPNPGCGCTGQFFVEVHGDGADQQLTRPGVGAFGPPSGGMPDACGVPWAVTTLGQTAVVAQVYACSSGTCISLAAIKDGFATTTGSYRDRAGHTQELKVQFTTHQDLFQAKLHDAVEGTYTATLTDGRSLTGRFRACILDFVQVA